MPKFQGISPQFIWPEKSATVAPLDPGIPWIWISWSGSMVTLAKSTHFLQFLHFRILKFSTWKNYTEIASRWRLFYWVSSPNSMAEARRMGNQLLPTKPTKVELSQTPWGGSPWFTNHGGWTPQWSMDLSKKGLFVGNAGGMPAKNCRLVAIVVDLVPRKARQTLLISQTFSDIYRARSTQGKAWFDSWRHESFARNPEIYRILYNTQLRKDVSPGYNWYNV